ncbi:hypothetical protein ABBQ38_012235 [Trebouxia sp. C0009 RCD-2024]
MVGYCMHSTHLGAVGHTRVRPHTLSSTPIRHQNGLVVYSLSKRTCKKATRRGQLHLLAASSTDVEPQNEVTRSAQDLAQGIQDFLEESQKALSIEEAPLPEHPVGEEGTIKVADCIDASVIRVPSDFLAREGLKLTPEYTIGKEIGGGVQGRVLALNTADGDKTDKLLKVMKYKLATAVTGLDVGLKREWLIGQQLNTITGQDGQLHGFMGTGACLLDQETDMPCGLIIEKVNGIPCEKRLASEEETFADVRYLLEMCRQVFGYLDTAWTEIGFTHGDLNCANVMEHRGDAEPYLPKGFSDSDDKANKTPLFKLPGDEDAQALEFRIIDYGHARLVKNKALAKLPKAPGLEKSYRKWWENKGDVWRLLQDIAVTVDGRTWPAKDEAQVRMLIGLIRKVTGVTISAFFKAKGTYKYSGQKMEMPWHSNSGFGHQIRKYRMRVWAFSFQRNTQMRPIEALQWMKGNEDYYRVKYGSK